MVYDIPKNKMRTIPILDIIFVEYTEKQKNKNGANLFFCKIKKGDKTDITDYVIKSGGFEKSRNGEIIIRILKYSSIIDDYNTGHMFENDIFNIFYDYLKQQFDICKTVRSSVDGDFKNIFDDCLNDTYNYYSLLETFTEQTRLINEYLIDPATLNHIKNSNTDLYNELVEQTGNTTILINAIDTVECGTLSEENVIKKEFYKTYVEMFKNKILKTVNTDIVSCIMTGFDKYEVEIMIKSYSSTYYSHKTEKDEYENVYSSSPNIIIHFVKNNNNKLCNHCGYQLMNTLFPNK